MCIILSRNVYFWLKWEKYIKLDVCGNISCLFWFIYDNFFFGYILNGIVVYVILDFFGSIESFKILLNFF